MLAQKGKPARNGTSSTPRAPGSEPPASSPVASSRPRPSEIEASRARGRSTSHRQRPSARRSAPNPKAWSPSGRSDSYPPAREPTTMPSHNTASEPPFAADEPLEDTSVRYSPAFGSTSETPDHLG